MISDTNNRIKIEGFVVGPIETNCYLVHDPRSLDAVVIDPGARDERLVSAVERGGLNIRFVVNTHGHYDHIMDDAGFGVPVLIHEADAGCLKDPSRSLSSILGGGTVDAEAVRTLSDGDIIKAGSIRMKVIHTPGHSPGGICLLQDKVLFSGDTLFFEGVGRTDLPGGDGETLLESVRARLFGLPGDIRVYPGHGPGTTIAHEKEHNPFV
ncbi:MAG: MBL fold metallo-hydrolase [Candidatus Omnitrophica bacterium]|nr:MBL fold metallo-hydrolase [Candidatus Omnitrophota bacterium]